ncbi:aminotransferase class III-fold pyridoxal phosphate-dependent enzyme [Streptomyces sp. JV176]|uniref:aspartate aminotransferase family protein n=1 Tax=Streptomyces sp. JV176 TaxID=858630 RepID=UPI002E79778F|nr:aminotransferase class III-fold pyridoxal phosphate-dependent enzyme [Streptomyces sp. JV176]MEE1801065.1 aminotransferase class III-fold pyridoxal phosphate-dependent enzyme [Streptomyces sp. JV176]
MTTLPADPPRPTRDSAVPETLLAEYRARTPGSAAAYQRATAVLPGGETRFVTYFPPYPVILAEGHGSRLLDVDGIEYLDLVNNYTSLIHGNAYPPAMAAAAAVLASGAVFPSPHELQRELAELLVTRIPSVRRVRFTNSGTEASVLAARLAQRATGRGRLLLFNGAYHGSAPPLLADGPEVVTVPYNDIDAVRDALTEDIAAVFTEPFLGAGGVIPGRPEFLRATAELARERGALFVLDEVQSLRNAVGGVQTGLGLHPDLTVMGKVIGGGMPIGAIGGSEELLRLTAATTERNLAHSGTFNGHLTAAAAGSVTLRHLDAPAIDRLDLAARRLADVITAASAAAGIPTTVTRAGSILNVHFTPTAPVDAEQARAATTTPLLSALHLVLLLDGVYTTPRGMINLSTALDADDLDRAARAYTHAFQRLADMEIPTPSR